MSSNFADIARQPCVTIPFRHETDRRGIEIGFWLVLLVSANWALLWGGTISTRLVFDSAAVTAGEWWRVFSFPWVHVSRYHLLLDGAAFLLLYAGIEERFILRRLLLVFGSGVGSLLLPLAISSQIHQIGLCGLSGIAHGLTAVSAGEMLKNPKQKRIGGWLLLGLSVKTVWELWTGTAFLQHLHLGDIGQPIVATHAGGVVGGLAGYLLLQVFAKYSRDKSDVL